MFDNLFSDDSALYEVMWKKYGSRTDQGKGKAIPFQAWAGPEGSRRLRLPDFKTIDT